MLTGRARDLGSALPSRSGPAWPGASPRVLPLLVPDTAANLTIVAVTELPSKRFRGFGSCREFAILAGAATGGTRRLCRPQRHAQSGVCRKCGHRSSASGTLSVDTRSSPTGLDRPGAAPRLGPPSLADSPPRATPRPLSARPTDSRRCERKDRDFFNPKSPHPTHEAAGRRAVAATSEAGCRAP